MASVAQKASRRVPEIRLCGIGQGESCETPDQLLQPGAARPQQPTPHTTSTASCNHPRHHHPRHAIRMSVCSAGHPPRNAHPSLGVPAGPVSTPDGSPQSPVDMKSTSAMQRWCGGLGTLAASPVGKHALSVQSSTSRPIQEEGLAPRPAVPGFQGGVCAPVDPGSIEKRQSV